MRVLFVTPRLPYLPCHEAARLAASHLWLASRAAIVAIRLLLREPLTVNTLARSARELVERRFTWRTVAERYETLYARLVPAPAVQATA